MKKEKKMGIELDPRYQIEAYEQVKNDFDNGNRSCVVFPTGCGKSYIALKMIEDNPDKEILYVSSSSVINVQIREIIEQTYGEDAKIILSKVKFLTYNALSKIDTEEFEKLNPDMIGLDELHRAGAPVWGKRVNELLEKNSNAKVLGLTATPVRTDGRNMTEEICGGISYELPLTEAVARGVLPVPEYICAQYLFEEDIQRVESLVEQVEDEETKQEYRRKIQEARRHLEQADGIDEILGRHIQKKNGKYIMFCKDIEDIDTKAEQAGKWFAQVNEQTTISKISSANEEKENTKELQFFRRRSDNALKLALAVNMLNEGYHDEELTGVLMARPTMSEILFRQQLGRALSRDSRETPQIFDMVNNIRYFEEFRKEIKEIIEKGLTGENKEQGEKRGYSKDILEKFKIVEEQIDFIEEFKKIEENLKEYTLGGYIKNALEIEKWCIENYGDKKIYERKLPSSYSKDEYEKRLGRALSNIRSVVMKKYNGKQLDEITNEEDRRIVEIVRRLDREYGNKWTGQDIGQASFDAPVEECDKAQDVLEHLIQTKENSKKGSE